ncbi:MAG TPA: hypothetical protein VI997_07705 [Candidatus Thermoplasmatota archaeon]|nr:hypothetical protein [Candidatus Thermoplasmatota archaeon]
MQWPIEAMPARYVTPFGGCSPDLYPWQVGVNARALRTNTGLEHGARILVSTDLGGQTRPLFARAMYEVVALDAGTPDASSLSPEGEAVFSSFELDGDARTRSVLHRLRDEATVVLNAAAMRFGPTF